jgi:UDP-glucuronate decarboxylase
MTALELNDFSEITAALGLNVRRFEGARILIPGGNGFLGTVFIRYFEYLNEHVLLAPVKIVAVDNYVVGVNPVVASTDRVTRLTHDLTTSLHLAVRGPFDYIINLAGMASPSAYMKVPLAVLDVSYIGTRNVLELAAIHGSRVLNFSSSECYGDPPAHEIPTKESYDGMISSTSKRAPYDCGKKVLEALSHVFREHYGVDVSIIRPFNVYGYMHRNDYRVIPNFVHNAFDQKPIKVYTPGTQTRTFCFYSDFIAGVLLVLLNGNDFCYNVGNMDNEITMEKLARTVESEFGCEGLVEIVDAPAVYACEPQRRCPDISRIRALGYSPKVSLNEGLKRIRTWLQNSA